ncbi:FAD-binding and (Fe-S)-binding domain-containing protein [Pirellulaceae bacterium SH449]
MDSEQTRLEADLRGILDGEVYCSPLFTQLYASDASLYEIPPHAVVRPRNESDVVQCVKYAAENSIPLFPRGGGTGQAGQSLGPGIVLDFSRFMRRVIQLDRENMTIRVQPGLTLAELNRSLSKHRLVFGADPVTRSVTTIGSVVAIDSIGSHYLAYGTACDSVLEANAVLANGDKVSLGKQRWRAPGTGNFHLDKIASGVGEILASYRAASKGPPWRGVARGCGYRIETSNAEYVDLAKLQSGAEGTLSILTELKLKVRPMPEARGVVLLFFERLESAVKAAADARRDKVAACDLMDRRLIELARDIDSRYEAMLPRGVEACLLIEHHGDEALDVRSRLTALVQRIVRRSPSTKQSRIILDDNERDFIWKLSRRVIPRLYRIKGNARPIPFVEDISIPPDRLPEFLVEVQNTLKAERVTSALFSHAAHGHIHLRPFLDPHSDDDVLKMQRIADRLFEKVIEYRGVISGEHAVGLSRSSYVRQQLGDLYPVCRSIKELFDPKGILNPGKLITDAPQKITDNLRPLTSLKSGIDHQLSQSGNATNGLNVGNGQEKSENDGGIHIPSRTRAFLPILSWTASDSLETVSDSCNGCGRCRSTAPNERMCPMFRAGRNEEASPRAKANLMRGFLDGRIPSVLIESDELKAIADSCFHCHQCRIECPSSVDIPKLVMEFKAQYAAINGLSLSDRVLGRLDLLSSIASRAPWLANWGIENRYARWLLEKSTGISQGRRLPLIAKQPFMRWAARNRLTRPNRAGGRKVLFLVDHYANWNNPQLGMAFVAVMQKQNVDVFVPAWQSVTWMTRIALGDVERVRKSIAPQIRLLAEAVRQGYEIVSTEPTAILCLKNEYVHIVDNDDARLVAKHSWEAGQYLWKMHQQNELELDLKPLSLSVVYHTPCHLRAIDQDHTGLNLLGLIPGVTVQNANAGCSGMAGTFGLLRRNYRTSLRVGWDLVSTMQQTSAQIGSTECAACKLQMEQGTDKPTIHPIALLAYAYGKLPSVGEWISSRNEGLSVK